jgi:hypothetical protein
MSGNQLSFERYAQDISRKVMSKQLWILVASWETDAFEAPKVGTLLYAVYESKPSISDLLESTSNVITTKNAIALLCGQTIVNDEDVVFDLYVWEK